MPSEERAYPVALTGTEIHFILSLTNNEHRRHVQRVREGRALPTRDWEAFVESIHEKLVPIRNQAERERDSCEL